MLLRDTAAITAAPGVNAYNYTVADVGDISQRIEQLLGWTVDVSVNAACSVRIRFTSSTNMEATIRNGTAANHAFSIDFRVLGALYTVNRYQTAISLNNNTAYTDQAITAVKSLSLAAEFNNGWTIAGVGMTAPARIKLTGLTTLRAYGTSIDTATMTVNSVIDG